MPANFDIKLDMVRGLFHGSEERYEKRPVSIRHPQVLSTIFMHLGIIRADLSLPSSKNRDQI